MRPLYHDGGWDVKCNFSATVATSGAFLMSDGHFESEKKISFFPATKKREKCATKWGKWGKRFNDIQYLILVAV